MCNLTAGNKYSILIYKWEMLQILAYHQNMIKDCAQTTHKYEQLQHHLLRYKELNLVMESVDAKAKPIG